MKTIERLINEISGENRNEVIGYLEEAVAEDMTKVTKEKLKITISNDI